MSSLLSDLQKPVDEELRYFLLRFIISEVFYLIAVLPLVGIAVSLFSFGVLDCLTGCRYPETPFHLAILLIITAVHALMSFHFSAKKISADRKELRATCLAALAITDLLIATIAIFGLS